MYEHVALLLDSCKPHLGSLSLERSEPRSAICPDLGKSPSQTKADAWQSETEFVHLPFSLLLPCDHIQGPLCPLLPGDWPLSL